MKFISDLRETSSKQVKRDILANANLIEQKVLYYTYNPHMKFGIVNIPETYSLGVNLGEANHEMFIILDELASRRLTGLEARNTVQTYAEIYGDLIYLICRKNLGCGISAKTINSVYHNFIPEFKVQLANTAPLYEITYPAIAQIKYDGVRMIARISDKQTKCDLLTRNGKLINCPYISNVLLKNIKQDIVLDGEITLDSGKMEDRTSISGRVNSSLKGGVLDHHDLVFNIFDCMPTEAFDTSFYNEPYFVRYSHIVDYVSKINDPLFNAVDCFKVNSASEALNYYEKITPAGYEGIILKSPKHKYTFKRSKDWLKLKAIKSADLKCTKTLSGRLGTKYDNSIGALVCSGMVEGKQVKVKVGSGLSDADRNKGADIFINNTIEIQYNSIIRNAQNTGWTLFLPRFVSVRLDK